MVLIFAVNNSHGFCKILAQQLRRSNVDGRIVIDFIDFKSFMILRRSRNHVQSQQ